MLSKFSYLPALESDLISETQISISKNEIDKMAKLQNNVVDFIILTILRHEHEFYKLVKHNFPTKYTYILGTTNKSIIEMITQTTTKFYNNIYHSFQNDKISDIGQKLIDICEETEYNVHILIKKLIRLTVDLHLDLWRENLKFDDNNQTNGQFKVQDLEQNEHIEQEKYIHSIQDEINDKIININFVHILTTNNDKNDAYPNLPYEKNAFDIIIDKQIEII